MSYSVEEVMAYHPDNRSVYDEIKESLHSLVPFVGAGLTVFAYGTWRDALNILADKITDEENKSKIETMITNGQYLEAAQLLEDLRGQMNLARDIANLFSPEQLERERAGLSSQSIALLPRLFSGLVLTTNFDETLEAVYTDYETPFKVVMYPGQPELLNQFLRHREHACGLFKIHGSVTGKFVDYSRIVFTKRQYDAQYKAGSSLTNGLKKCLNGRPMLFLGCSLQKDRTMDILHDIAEPGEYHYAILNCPKEQRDKRIKELGAIRAILYEDDRHEAVRTILEQLLKDREQEASLPESGDESSDDLLNEDCSLPPQTNDTSRGKRLRQICMLAIPAIFISALAILGNRKALDEPPDRVPAGIQDMQPTDLSDEPFNGIPGETVETFPDEILDELSDFNFWLDGIEYRLPFPFQKLIENGWEVSSVNTDFETKELASNQFCNASVCKENTYITLTLSNTTETDMPLDQCDVAGILVKYRANGDNPDFRIAKGISTTSAAEAVLEAFGHPAQQQRKDNDTILAYHFNGEFKFAEFHLSDDPETGILQSAEIELRNLDGIDYVPPTYPRYVPPEELKGEYNSGILEIDKKLYQLPCPLSEFTDDGWEISVGVTGNTSHTVLEAFGGVSSWNQQKKRLSGSWSSWQMMKITMQFTSTSFQNGLFRIQVLISQYQMHL